MDKSLLLALAQTLFPFVISPGASFVLTLSASALGVRFAAGQVWAGTALGIVLLALVSALGMAPLILAYPLLRTALAVAGGVLLIVWGLRICLRPARRRTTALPARLWQTAFGVVISNVKAIMLYAIVLPALPVMAQQPFAFYAAAAALHAAMLLGWLLLVAAVVRRLPDTRYLQAGLLYASGAFMAYLGGKSLWSAW